MALSGHPLITSVPKQVSPAFGTAVVPPKLAFASDLETLAHYFGAFHAPQLPEDIHVFEPKHWALI